MARKKEIIPMDPWLFNGKPFTQDDADGLAGFVYLITEKATGKMYVGKKFFSGMRKQKGKTRRSRVASDWERYFGSCDELKALVKANGPNAYEREILSLHELKRDVNFAEVREQFQRDVLETVDENGNRVYFNENIQGRFFPGLVMGWKDRTRFSRSD